MFDTSYWINIQVLSTYMYPKMLIIKNIDYY